MLITVVGGGYVGMISAVCFCEFGFEVHVVETEKAKLEKLQKYIAPSYEPGLGQAMQKQSEKGLLTFHSTLVNSITSADAIVVTIPTATRNNVDSDLSNLHEIIEQISMSLTKDKYRGIFIKTSVPVGTCSIIANNVKFMRPDLTPGEHYDIIANPGFLREGSAIHDFMVPNRSIIGLEHHSRKAQDLIEKIYASQLSLNVPFIYSNFATAELIRSSTIGFIAVKMAFINELAELCDRCGADIDTLIKGISLDQRIGHKALVVSPGFGGASYPRTTRILSKTADSLGVDLGVINGALKSNANRISKIKDRIINLIANDSEISLKKVTILGLSFKPLTSDLRESSSIFVIRDLLQLGADVSAYDPLFTSTSTEVDKIPNDIMKNKKFHLNDSVYDAVSQSDIAVIMTNWPEFISLDLKKVYELMNKQPNAKPIILDYRNMFSRQDMADFEYISQGHGNSSENS